MIGAAGRVRQAPCRTAIDDHAAAWRSQRGRRTIPPGAESDATGRNSVAKAQTGTLYRGHEGMWSWVAHRVSGMLIFLFLIVHVLDTALVRVSPEAYNEVIGHYKTVVFGLGEVGLVGAVIFHALNGLRIILVDFWSQGTQRQRALFWGVVVVWTILMAGFLPRHLMHMFGG
jgi:succinate dehydrogenase / fumarate reductase cytochrome b subunit